MYSNEPRYRFSVEHSDDEGNLTFGNTLEFTAEQLPDVVGNFELFLKGSGFAFDGHVDITPSDYTQYNNYNNHPDPGYFDELNKELRETAEIHVKRPADTEGGSLE
jgi:hypothetical protein